MLPHCYQAALIEEWVGLLLFRSFRTYYTPHPTLARCARIFILKDAKLSKWLDESRERLLSSPTNLRLL
jgi:hypothetical protein